MKRIRPKFLLTDKSKFRANIFRKEGELPFKRPRSILIRRYFPVAKKLFMIIFVSISLIGTYKYFTTTDKFQITDYKYSGVVAFVNKQDFEEVVKANAMGKNIFSFDTRNLESSLTKSFLGIKKVKVSKKYFNSLIINVQERTPIAIISDKTQKKFLIDADGYVLGETADNNTQYPTVNYEETLSVGGFIDKSIVPVTLQIILEAKEQKVDVSSVSYKPEFTLFYVQNDIMTYINNDKNIKLDMKVISNLINKANADNKKIGKIDLRYDKVIVLYK